VEVADRSVRRPPTGLELVLEVDDLDAERGQVAEVGWPVLDEVTRRPWGCGTSGCWTPTDTSCGSPTGRRSSSRLPVGAAA
jgi:hypothetical protein